MCFPGFSNARASEVGALKAGLLKISAGQRKALQIQFGEVGAAPFAVSVCGQVVKGRQSFGDGVARLAKNPEEMLAREAGLPVHLANQ